MHSSGPERRRLRVMLIAPNSPPPHLSGGMDIAIADVAAQLRQRGWTVDIPLAAVGTGVTDGDPAIPGSNTLFVHKITRPPRLLSWLRRSRLGRFARLPEWMRGYLGLFVNRSTARKFNANLFALERLFTTLPQPDAVLLFCGFATPGICALSLAMFPRTVAVSLPELAIELKSAWVWPLLRRVFSLRLREGAHSFFYRAVSVEKIQCAVFASNNWRDEAIRYGLSRSVAHSIYFGVPWAPLTARPSFGGRLLWVGRMNPGKGLHQLVRALPVVRTRVAGATLTVIAKYEDESYRAAIIDAISALQLEDAIRLLPRIERAKLWGAYAGHDILLCISPYSEPVPLVLMEAFMAGLPVIVSQPRVPSPLVLPGQTCLCFDPDAPDTLAEAVELLQTDPALRKRLAENARKLIEERFSTEYMGEQYDALLRTAASEFTSNIVAPSRTGQMIE
jgi:glycosyltransferase involved in cell wall biosynthesis